ncbi:MAG TPA: hypothetical protein VKZ53_22680 [Candidatus Angelobacter sp.]|nr:hypothetical protein [Candidatus Angelobacter sp.]
MKTYLYQATIGLGAELLCRAAGTRSFVVACTHGYATLRRGLPSRRAAGAWNIGANFVPLNLDFFKSEGQQAE